jgi:hypothetical protein
VHAEMGAYRRLKTIRRQPTRIAELPSLTGPSHPRQSFGRSRSHVACESEALGRWSVAEPTGTDAHDRSRGLACGAVSPGSEDLVTE